MEDGLKLVFGPNPYRPETPIHGGVEFLGIFLPSLSAVPHCLRRAGDRRGVASGLPNAARRDGARRRLRPQHGRFARRAGRAGSSPVLSPSASRWRRSPACCCRRSIPCSPPWGTTSSCSRLPSSSSAAWADRRRRGRGPIATQVQAIAALYISPVWTDPIVFGIMVVMLMVRPQGLFGRIGHA